MFISHILKSVTFKRWLITGIAACILVSVLMIGAIYMAPTVFKANLIMTQNQWVFTLFRWFSIIIFYCLWPWLVRRKAETDAWTEKKETYWLQQRTRIIIWLAVFELLVCENMLWRLFHWV